MTLNYELSHQFKRINQKKRRKHNVVAISSLTNTYFHYETQLQIKRALLQLKHSYFRGFFPSQKFLNLLQLIQ